MHRIRATNHDRTILSHVSLDALALARLQTRAPVVTQPLSASLLVHVTCHQPFTWMQASFLVKRPDLLGCTNLTSITNSATTVSALLADMSCHDLYPGFSVVYEQLLVKSSSLGELQYWAKPPKPHSPSDENIV
jgi:hypothetical protein